MNNAPRIYYRQTHVGTINRGHVLFKGDPQRWRPTSAKARVSRRARNRLPPPARPLTRDASSLATCHPPRRARKAQVSHGRPVGGRVGGWVAGWEGGRWAGGPRAAEPVNMAAGRVRGQGMCFKPQSPYSQHAMTPQSTYSQHTVNIQSTYSQHDSQHLADISFCI